MAPLVLSRLGAAGHRYQQDSWVVTTPDIRRGLAARIQPVSKQALTNHDADRCHTGSVQDTGTMVDERTTDDQMAPT